MPRPAPTPPARHGRLASLAAAARRKVRFCVRILRDPRTPWPARLLLGAAVAYALSPVDLVPDFIPVLGHLDDLLVVPLLAWAGLALVPREVLRDAREAVKPA